MPRRFSLEQLLDYLGRTSLGTHLESGYEVILASRHQNGNADRFRLVKDASDNCRRQAARSVSTVTANVSGLTIVRRLNSSDDNALTCS